MSAAAASERTWTVLELLRWTTGHFERKGIETPRLDAECLLSHALGTDRLGLYLDFEKPVSLAEREAFRGLVRRRADERMPVAQLLGRREFWSLELEVTPDVLVPRPETETLVQVALDAAASLRPELDVLDLGTGSGAIAVALARELPAARVTATDVSAEALAVAGRNAGAHGVADRIRLVRGDALAAVAGERFDLIVSNPPYVAERDADALAPELRHEPRTALFAGPDGTDLLRRIAAGLPEALAPGGFAAVEVGAGQAPEVSRWMREAGLERVNEHRDAGGRPRVVSAARADAPAAAPGGGG
jgi:release factor glutamine methyltransferase